MPERVSVGAVLQACDLVPIVEPEILIDGDYDIHRSSSVSQEVFQASQNRNLSKSPLSLQSWAETHAFPGKGVLSWHVLDCASCTIQQIFKSVRISHSLEHRRASLSCGGIM